MTLSRVFKTTSRQIINSIRKKWNVYTISGGKGWATPSIHCSVHLENCYKCCQELQNTVAQLITTNDWFRSCNEHASTRQPVYGRGIFLACANENTLHLEGESSHDRQWMFACLKYFRVHTQEGVLFDWRKVLTHPVSAQYMHELHIHWASRIKET